MARYRQAFKDSVVAKLFPPESAAMARCIQIPQFLNILQQVFKGFRHVENTASPRLAWVVEFCRADSVESSGFRKISRSSPGSARR